MKDTNQVDVVVVRTAGRFLECRARHKNELQLTGDLDVEVAAAQKKCGVPESHYMLLYKNSSQLKAKIKV